MATIYHQIRINASPETVFKAISEQDGLSNWWLKDCIAKAELGFVNIFRVSPYPENEMKVIDIKPFERLEWECLKSDKEWIGTHISFEISRQNDLTKLDFKHSGWSEQSEFFGICNYHWARHLNMLIKYCENGKDQIDAVVENNEIRKVKGQ